MSERHMNPPGTEGEYLGWPSSHDAKCKCGNPPSDLARDATPDREHTCHDHCPCQLDGDDDVRDLRSEWARADRAETERDRLRDEAAKWHQQHLKKRVECDKLKAGRDRLRSERDEAQEDRWRLRADMRIRTGALCDVLNLARDADYYTAVDEADQLIRRLRKEEKHQRDAHEEARKEWRQADADRIRARTELADMTAQRDAALKEHDEPYVVANYRRRAEAAEADRDAALRRATEAEGEEMSRGQLLVALDEITEKLDDLTRNRDTTQAEAERDELQARIDRAVALATAYAGHGEYAVNSAAVARDIRELLQPAPPADDSSEAEEPPFAAGQWVRLESHGEPFEPFQVAAIGRDEDGEWVVPHPDGSGVFVPVDGFEPWTPKHGERVTGDMVAIPGETVTGSFLASHANDHADVGTDSGDIHCVSLSSLRPAGGGE